MKFNIKNLGLLDESAKNILYIEPPYYLDNAANSENGADAVIFLGNDFKNTPGGVNIEEYVRINNRCLDFVRRNCSQYKLLYSCHPAETDEFKLLDLAGFEMIKDKGTREMYMYKNLSRIKYVFSVCSGTSRAAHEMGLNSYIFFDLFGPAFSRATGLIFRDYLAGMPSSFYIKDLDNYKLEENRLVFKKDELLENHLTDFLDKNPGTVWFTAIDSSFIVIMSLLSRLIKKIAPDRKVGLLVMQHKRWGQVDADELMKNFDELKFFPVTNLSFKFKNLLNMLITIRAAKKFNIGNEDSFLCIGPFTFLENCFISYHNNSSIALTLQSTFEQTHYFENPIDVSDFKIKITPLIFNKIIFPVLGLKRILRLHRPSGRNGLYFFRYEKPINEIFNAVYVLKATH